MIRLAFIMLSLCCAVPSGCQAPPTDAPPNILFIAIDDLRTELGCYGLDYVQSPHLDRLASQGILFTNHFVQAPSCGPSRYALLTGRSPRTSGVTSNNNAFFRGKASLSPEQTAGAQTMPELFRRNGYHTVLIGKISHTPDGEVWSYDGTGDGRPELPNAWDEYATPYGVWERGWGAFFAYQGGAHREDGGGHRDLMQFTAEQDENLPDGMMAARAIQELRRLKDRKSPFFLALGFYKPHLPFVAPREDWEAFEHVEIPLPAHSEKPESTYWHQSREFFRYEHAFGSPRQTPPLPPLSEIDQQNARRAYLACVRYVDRQVGKVLAELDRLGLAENTIVVVWGDHGWHLGDSAIWGKHSPHERALRSTLIMRAPMVGKPGMVSDAFVESTDLYPTLIDLCNPAHQETQWPLDGLSLEPILSGHADSVREVAISYWQNVVSLRSHRYRLITRVDEGGRFTDVELYDMSESADPQENIAASQPQIVGQLTELIRWRDEARETDGGPAHRNMPSDQ